MEEGLPHPPPCLPQPPLNSLTPLPDDDAVRSSLWKRSRVRPSIPVQGRCEGGGEQCPSIHPSTGGGGGAGPSFHPSAGQVRASEWK